MLNTNSAHPMSKKFLNIHLIVLLLNFLFPISSNLYQNIQSWNKIVLFKINGDLFTFSILEIIQERGDWRLGASSRIYRSYPTNELWLWKVPLRIVYSSNWCEDDFVDLIHYLYSGTTVQLLHNLSYKTQDHMQQTCLGFMKCIYDERNNSWIWGEIMMYKYLWISQFVKIFVHIWI